MSLITREIKNNETGVVNRVIAMHYKGDVEYAVYHSGRRKVRVRVDRIKEEGADGNLKNGYTLLPAGVDVA